MAPGADPLSPGGISSSWQGLTPQFSEAHLPEESSQKGHLRRALYQKYLKYGLDRRLCRRG